MVALFEFSLFEVIIIGSNSKEIGNEKCKHKFVYVH
jgi:hypothetical protein